MLRMARVTSRDVIYDLGCGDGKIVIAAAKRFGARGVGIDIDPERIQEANAAARAAGVANRVSFSVGDIFSADVKIGDATVVARDLLPSLNERLRPKLWRELKPGTRVVSNSFDGHAWRRAHRASRRALGLPLARALATLRVTLPACPRAASAAAWGTRR